MVFEKLVERLIIKGEIITQTPLHIGSGEKDIEIGEADRPIITDTLEQPYIPGSSIKGKVRSEAERIARDSQFVCTPPQIKAMCGTLKSAEPKPQQEFCICCRIFGTSGDISVGSKVKFRDAYPIQHTGSLITRAAIALDRNTGAVVIGPYHTEAVPANTRFYLEIVCDNMEQNEIKLLRAALKSVQDSALGGFSSRGFGKVKFKFTNIVRRTAGYYLGEEQEVSVEAKLLDEWQKALEAA